jgi:hypothetical protein
VVSKCQTKVVGDVVENYMSTIADNASSQLRGFVNAVKT